MNYKRTRAEVMADRAAARGAVPPGRRFSIDYRPSFANVALKLSMAGITSTVDIAAHFNVPESKIRRWREDNPAFNRAFTQGNIEMTLELLEVAKAQALAGDGAQVRYLLDRRAPAFRPVQKIEQTLDSSTLAAIMAKHKLRDEDEMRERGLILDDED